MVTRPRPASAHVHRKGISARRAPAKVAFGTAVEKPGPKQKDVAAPAAAPIVAPEPEKKLSKAEMRRQEAQQEVQQEAEEHAKVLRQAEAQLEAGGSSKEPLQAKLSRSARRLSVASSAAKALGVQMEREVRYDRESVMSIFARSTGSSDQPRFGKRSEARLRADGSASAVAAAEEKPVDGQGWLEIQPLIPPEEVDRYPEAVLHAAEVFETKYRQVTRAAEKMHRGLAGRRATSAEFARQFNSGVREILFNRFFVEEKYSPFAQVESSPRSPAQRSPHAAALTLHPLR